MPIQMSSVAGAPSAPALPSSTSSAGATSAGERQLATRPFCVIHSALRVGREHVARQLQAVLEVVLLHGEGAPLGVEHRAAVKVAREPAIVDGRSASLPCCAIRSFTSSAHTVFTLSPPTGCGKDVWCRSSVMYLARASKGDAIREIV